MARNITCPLCGNAFPLPDGWARPPFRCPYCREQLQASLKYAAVMRYLWGELVLLSLLVWLNAGPWWVYLSGGAAIYFSSLAPCLRPCFLWMSVDMSRASLR